MSATPADTERISRELLQASRAGNWTRVLERIYWIESLTPQAKQHAVVELSQQKNLRTGNTVGHFAAIADQVEVLERLDKLGVSLRTSNFANRSPLEEARRRNAEVLPASSPPSAAVTYILNHVYSPVERLFYGDDDYEATVKVFTEFPDAINDTLECYNRMTWACLCAEEARVDELRWLYDHGANFHVVDEWGNGLLHMLPVPCREDDDDDEEFESSSECSSKKQRSDAESSDSDSATLPRRSPQAARSTSTATTTQMLTQQSLPPAELELLPILEPLDDLSSDEQRALQALVFLLSLKIFDLNRSNNSGATAAHVFAEKSCNNPELAWKALRLLRHCGADLNLCDDDGANVAMVLAAHSGDGQWLSWCLAPVDNQGGGCDPNHVDARGRKIEDYIVTANLETFDSELDIDEEFLEASDEESESS